MNGMNNPCATRALRQGLAALSFSALFLFGAAAGLSQPMELTVCSVTHKDKDAEAKLELMKKIGVTSIQTYIFWNQVEKVRGVMDWSEYDADVALFKKHGIKWVPFVIAGPWYVTPEFVRRDKDIVMYRCLEHDRESAIPSLWSPKVREYVREYLKKFAEHFLPMGVLESVNLGITGDYGEAIYSVIGNWPGEYHSHGGFWCGDLLAKKDFRRAMKDLYKNDIQALNRSWKTGFCAFGEITPFLPDKAPSLRARLEFLRWYRDSMTNYAEFWMAAAREFFPGTEIYLCTGGDMAPEHGSDFSAQAKVAAKFNGGIRITNEASSFPHNVRLTRLVGSACRFYGAYFGHEPASAVTPVGMLGRLFNAVTSGARQLFLYNTPELIGFQDGNLALGDGGRFHEIYSNVLRTTKPIIDVALLYPTSSTTHVLKEDGRFGDLAAEIRRFVDYDLLDERLIRDGALKTNNLLIMAGADVLEIQTLAVIRGWVESGGVLFVLDSRPTDWDGDPSASDSLAGFTPGSDEIRGITELAVDAPGRMPSIASLSSVIVARAFKDISPDAESLLSMRYSAKGRVAWKRKSGAGRVYSYFGPMDLRQHEESWVPSQKLPIHFLKDAIQDCINENALKKSPQSLNLKASDVYIVETEEGLMVLNMGGADKKVESPAGTFDVPARSILKNPGR